MSAPHRSAASRLEPPPAYDPPPRERLAERLSDRLERPLDRAPERRDDSTQRLQQIAQQLADLAQRERESVPFAPYQPERARDEESEALARIAQRIDLNERQTVEAFSAVNERLSRLGQQLGLARQPAYERPEDVPGYPALESAIRSVVEHLEVSEKRTRDSLKSMQERLGELTERAAEPLPIQSLYRVAPVLSGLESRLTDMGSRLQRTESLVQSGMPEAVRREIAQIEARIEAMLASAERVVTEAQASAREAAREDILAVEQRLLSALDQAQAAIPALQGEVGSLAARVTEIAAAAGTGERDMHALRIAVEQLSTRVAQGQDTRALAEMDRRLADIGDRLEEATRAAADPAQFGALEQRIADIDRRIAAAIAMQSDGQPLLHLEQSVAGLDSRFAQAEEQLRHLETMEIAIRQLYDGLEQSRIAARETAEEIASRTLDRLLPMANAPSPELAALEDGLRAVRDTAENAERRNQDSLSAIHATLAQVVQKIAELERSAIAPAGTGHEAAAAEAGILEEPVAAPPPPAAQASATASPLTGSDDFIAAARRAAQAAAARPSGLRADQSRVPDGGKRSGSFSFLRPKAEAPAAPASAPEVKPAAASARRKTLIYAGILLVIAASLFAYRALALPQGGAQETTMLQGAAPEPVESQPVASQPGAAGGAAIAAVVAAPDAPAAELPPAAAGPAALRQAAASGDSRAQYIVAGRYLDGRGVAQDVAVAAAWYQRAAARGLAPAQYRLASLLERGTGVAKDARLALHWYERAADGGNVTAMHNAAVLAAGPEAGPPDYAKARRWFAAAAEHGFAPSQFNLAVLSEQGLGAEADSAEAYVWYSIAARSGDAESRARAAALRNALPADVRAAADRRVKAFVPKVSDQAANSVTVNEPSWGEVAPAQPAAGEAPGVSLFAPDATAPMRPVNSST